jgi:hypothetical protein
MPKICGNLSLLNSKGIKRITIKSIKNLYTGSSMGNVGTEKSNKGYITTGNNLQMDDFFAKIVKIFEIQMT